MKAWIWWTYIWRVLVNIFYLLVTLYVFSRLHERLETIVVACFGMIYVTVRSIGLGQAISQIAVVQMIDGEFSTIKKLIRPYEDEDTSWIQEEKEEAQSVIRATRVKLYIEWFFLGLISLLCLYVFFNTV
jgi:hypothetical protein